MIYLVRRILKQVTGDKRLMGLLFGAPLIMLTLIYFLLGNGSFKPVIATQVNAVLQQALQQQDCTLRALPQGKQDAWLKEKTVDAVLLQNGAQLQLKFLENDGIKVGAVNKVIQKAVSSLQKGADIQLTFLYGKENGSLFDHLGYIMLCVMAFFFVFILSGVSFVRERSHGTLERFILSPIRRWQIILGYTLAYGMLAVVQTMIQLFFAEFVLGLAIGSALPLAILILVLLALTAVVLGILVSIVSTNEFQIVQFIPILVIPQIFFSGLIPLDTLPLGIGKISVVMPMFYACDALKKCFLYHQGFGDIIFDLAVLIGMILLLSFINIRVLRRVRKL